jgi:hypothetical protein
MKTRGRYFLLILPVILLMLAVLLFPGFFYRNLIDPITRIFWLLLRTVLSIDQELIWILLIAIGSVAMLLMIPGTPKDDLRSAYSYSEKSENRVSYWKSLLQGAEKNPDHRLLLQNNLEELSQAVDEVSGCEMQEITLPESKFGFMRTFVRLWRKLSNEIHPRHTKLTDIELEHYIDQKLDSMESLMEIHYERSEEHTQNR